MYNKIFHKIYSIPLVSTVSIAILIPIIIYLPKYLTADYRFIYLGFKTQFVNIFTALTVSLTTVGHSLG